MSDPLILTARAPSPSSWGRARADVVGRDDTRVTEIQTALVAASLWVLCHPYGGIVGDSTIYLGRVLANLDPDRLGRDLLFANDGQSRFSLFPHLVQGLVAALGAARAGIVVAALGSACWFAGLVAVARSLARGRAAWAIVMIVAALPMGYGQPGIFFFGETSAIPRPFAEAAVLGGLAALAADKKAAAVVLLIGATLLHPIMALPGWGVVLVVSAWGRLDAIAFVFPRSAVWFGGGLAFVALIGCLIWPPVPSFARIDEIWLAILRERSPHLFPTLWRPEAFAALLVHAATLAIAADLATKPWRRILWAVLVTGVAGLAASAWLGDWLQVLPVLQAQPWRALWLVALVAGCGLAFSIPLLWRRGPTGRVSLAALALAWVLPPDPVTSSIAVATALMLHVRAASWGWRVQTRHEVAAWAFVGGLTLYGTASLWRDYLAFRATVPADWSIGSSVLLRNHLQTVPIFVLVVSWLLIVRARANPAWTRVGLVAAFALSIAAAAVWDQRMPAVVDLETPQPSFERIIGADSSRDILWLDGRAEAWFALGRPQWASAQQGVAAVFSRNLAVAWWDRARRLVAAGLAAPAMMEPFADAPPRTQSRLTRVGLDRFCAAPDAPGLIVVPVKQDLPLDADIGGQTWRLSHPFYVLEPTAVTTWRRVEGYRIVHCAKGP